MHHLFYRLAVLLPILALAIGALPGCDDSEADDTSAGSDTTSSATSSDARSTSGDRSSRSSRAQRPKEIVVELTCDGETITLDTAGNMRGIVGTGSYDGAMKIDINVGWVDANKARAAASAGSAEEQTRQGMQSFGVLSLEINTTTNKPGEYALDPKAYYGSEIDAPSARMVFDSFKRFGVDSPIVATDGSLTIDELVLDPETLESTFPKIVRMVAKFKGTFRPATYAAGEEAIDASAEGKQVSGTITYNRRK